MLSARQDHLLVLYPLRVRLRTILLSIAVTIFAHLDYAQPALSQEATSQDISVNVQAVQTRKTEPIELPAALTGKIQDKPIVIAYARNISPPRIFGYVTGLSKRLSIGKTLVTQMDDESTRAQLELLTPKTPDPLYGFAAYLVSGLIPSFEMVSFQQVVDEDDARRVVNSRNQQWGHSGSFIDLGNGCFKIQMTYSNSYPMPAGMDEKQLQNETPQPRGRKFQQKIVEKDGVKHIEQTTTMQTLFRYHDSVLYEADFDDLFEMTLPSADAIAQAVDGSTDLGFQAYLDRVPLGMRQLAWNMLGAAAGSQLQQRDDEPDSTYNMRKTSGDLALSLIQAVLFDIDNSNGWAKFATADDDSVRGQLRIRARNNSALAKQLVESAGNSRFAPILGDNAAATLHVCVRLPAESTRAMEATSAWLTEEMQKEFSTDPNMLAAGQAFSGVLNGIGEHRTLELLVKAGWTETSDGVFYGGIQLHEQPDLLKNLHYSLTHMPHADPQIAEMVTFGERDGLSLITMSFPADATAEFSQQLGINLTHAYLAHQSSCLWFAAGTENSYQIIRQSLNLCTENSRAARTPLASGRIDMERWLSYPQDDPARIAQLPYWLDENARWFPPMALGMGFYGGGDKPDPIMQSVFDLGGSKQAGFSIEADESGLLLLASLGEALANHMVARMIDNQESSMRRSAEQLEEARKSQNSSQEKAAKEFRPEPVP